MTVEEKRKILDNYCSGESCDNCVLINEHWEHRIESMGCLMFMCATEEEIDKAILLLVDNNKITPNELREANDLPPVKEDTPITPNYYNDTKIAPIDVIEDWDLDFCLGSALKYIKRAGKKENNPSVQDLKKVIWYIERRIKELEEVE
jgi:hypothetical protein